MSDLPFGQVIQLNYVVTSVTFSVWSRYAYFDWQSTEVFSYALLFKKILYYVYIHIHLKFHFFLVFIEIPTNKVTKTLQN